MHEYGLVEDLVRKVGRIAAAEGAVRVTRVRLWAGALTHLSEPNLRSLWAELARGSVASGAELLITVSDDPSDPRAQSLLLQSVDVGA